MPPELDGIDTLKVLVTIFDLMRKLTYLLGLWTLPSDLDWTLNLTA